MIEILVIWITYSYHCQGRVIAPIVVWVICQVGVMMAKRPKVATQPKTFSWPNCPFWRTMSVKNGFTARIRRWLWRKPICVLDMNKGELMGVRWEWFCILFIDNISITFQVFGMNAYLFEAFQIVGLSNTKFQHKYSNISMSSWKTSPCRFIGST